MAQNDNSISNILAHQLSLNHQHYALIKIGTDILPVSQELDDSLRSIIKLYSIFLERLLHTKGFKEVLGKWEFCDYQDNSTIYPFSDVYIIGGSSVTLPAYINSIVQPVTECPDGMIPFAIDESYKNDYIAESIIKKLELKKVLKFVKSVDRKILVIRKEPVFYDRKSLEDLAEFFSD